MAAVAGRIAANAVCTPDTFDVRSLSTRLWQPNDLDIAARLSSVSSSGTLRTNVSPVEVTRTGGALPRQRLLDFLPLTHML